MPFDECITLKEAVEIYHLDAAQLTRWADDGTIWAGRLDGQILLKETDVERAALGDTGGSLAGHRLISLGEAARRYDVPAGVLERFARGGRIRSVRRDDPNDGLLLVERDVRELARTMGRDHFAHLREEITALNRLVVEQREDLMLSPNDEVHKSGDMSRRYCPLDSDLCTPALFRTAPIEGDR